MSATSVFWIECPTHGALDAGRVDRLLPGGRVAARCPRCVETAFAEAAAGTRPIVANVLGGDDGWRTEYVGRRVRWTDRGERASSCGARCRHAKRDECDCECRGANHGADR